MEIRYSRCKRSDFLSRKRNTALRRPFYSSSRWFVSSGDHLRLTHPAPHGAAVFLKTRPVAAAGTRGAGCYIDRLVEVQSAQDTRKCNRRRSAEAIYSAEQFVDLASDREDMSKMLSDKVANVCFPVSVHTDTEHSGYNIVP
jgi:hypothetical protein